MMVPKIPSMVDTFLLEGETQWRTFGKEMCDITFLGRRRVTERNR